MDALLFLLGMVFPRTSITRRVLNPTDFDSEGGTEKYIKYKKRGKNSGLYFNVCAYSSVLLYTAYKEYSGFLFFLESIF